MVGATIGIIVKARLHIPDRFRDVVMIVLGISMGSGVTPEALAAAALWPASLVMLGIVVVAIMVATIVVLARFGWDRETAFYASAPGALSTVLLMAEASKADMRRVVVAQSLRLFVLVAVLPSLVTALEPTATGIAPPQPAGGLLTGWVEYAAMLAAGLAGAALGKSLHLPAGLLLGAVIGSALVHATSVVTTAVPNAILIPSFVVLGAFIALRFRGTTLEGLRRDLAASTVALVIAIVVAFLGAVVVSRLLGIPLADALIAYAPGGLEAMIILAFALGLDIAYVGTHHLVRFLGIALLLPLAARFVTPRGKT
jgi:membrane AbrB-like protein